MKKKIVIILICLCVLAVMFIPAILNVSSSLKVKNDVTEDIENIKNISKAVKKKMEVIKDEDARLKIEKEIEKSDNDLKEKDINNIRFHKEKITGDDVTVVSLDPLDEIEWLMDNIYLEDLYVGGALGFDRDITEIQWENIKVDEIVNLVKGMLTSIDKLLLDVPQSKILTSSESSRLRALIIKYSSSLSFLIRQGERNVSAKEALSMVVTSYNSLMQYFNNLSTSMKIKGKKLDVSIDDIKFDKFFASPDIKKITNSNFNFLTSTSINLTRVDIRENEERSSISFSVEIEGADMARLEIFNQYGLYENITVNYKGEKKEKRGYSFDKSYPARGIYVIKVINSLGKYYYKRYLFYPRVKIFPLENGSYKLPFLQDESQKLDDFFEIQSVNRINGNFIDRQYIEGF